MFAVNAEIVRPMKWHECRFG